MTFQIISKDTNEAINLIDFDNEYCTFNNIEPDNNPIIDPIIPSTISKFLDIVLVLLIIDNIFFHIIYIISQQ